MPVTYESWLVLLSVGMAIQGAYVGLSLAGKARCRFHGGLSTGSKTEAGRARIAEAQRRRWREYRERQADDVQAIRGTPMDGT